MGFTSATVTQSGPRFNLAWTLSTAEAVEVRRTDPAADPELLATVASGTLKYRDLLDTPEVGDVVTYTLTGVTSAEVKTVYVTVAYAIPPLDDDRRYEAAMLIGARLWKRKDAPFGVAGGGDQGSVKIGFKDPDVEMMLTGLRIATSDLSLQTWPDVDAFRARIQASEAQHADAVLATVLASAIADVTRRCKGSGMA